MNEPTLLPARRIAGDTFLLGAWMPVPGFGVLPVNAFLIKGAEPVLVDTGLAALREPFLRELGTLIDPADLRWIWLTHVDADHVGNLAAILDIAPHARVVTTYLGMGKMGMLGLPLDRVYLLNPGQSLALPDRDLHALRPPVFDAPETTAIFDAQSRHCFTADCFGGLLAAPAETAAELDEDALHAGMTAWATVDAPWLHDIQRDRFRASLSAFGELGARAVLGSHLPPAFDMTERLVDILSQAPAADPFVGPDQSALEAMMATGT